MTEYSVKCTGKCVEVICKNHASSDVCRGVSALIYALVNKLKFDAEQEKVKNLSIKLDDGAALIAFEYKKQFEDSVSSALETVCLGMQAIASSYPEELRVDITGG